MIFPYSLIVSSLAGSGDFVVLRRPEITITLVGPSGSASFVGLVDTGADNTIFPASAAAYLGITLQDETESSATVFGGQRVRLLLGEATLRLEADDEVIEWTTLLNFFEYEAPEDEAVILGHAGFLDFFTATFDGEAGVLTLIPNSGLA
jgi:hypothetical protein